MGRALPTKGLVACLASALKLGAGGEQGIKVGDFVTVVTVALGIGLSSCTSCFFTCKIRLMLLL